MIKELPCGNLISCGLDGQLFLYDENCDLIDNIKVINDWIYSISEIPNTENEFMACCPEKILLISVKDNKLDINPKRLYMPGTLNHYVFATKDDEIILCQNKKLSQFNGNLIDIKMENKNNLSSLQNIHTTYGIKITDNIICVVSNEIVNGGENSLKYINIKNKKEINSEENSFNINQNSLLLVDSNIETKNVNITPSGPSNNKKKNKRNKKNKKVAKETDYQNKEKLKLLFCACTRYKEVQKNGILILCTNGKKIKDNFYDTDDFEVFCFCLLQNNECNKDKNYFFVGGFDNNLNQGLIKLYEIIYDENNKIDLTKIKFIKNIPNLSQFKQPINSIIQHSKTGNIIFTSWDGTVNLFSKPNLEDLT